MPTISDVAKKAGLSRSTVSRVINNYPYVSKEKKELVLKVMKELKYIPNSSAQNLRKQQTNTIAVLVPKLSNPFFAHLVESLEDEATKHSYQILICNTRYSKQKELEFLQLLKSKHVDGIIMTSIENEWDDIQAMVGDGPIVLCNEYDSNAKVPSIRLNQLEGGYMGTLHLIKQGHTKIAYCWGGIHSGLSNDRLEGFKKAMAKFDLPIRQQWLFEDVFDIQDGRRVMQEIMYMDERPTAVFTGSDDVAAGMIAEAKAFGLSIPKDLAVIGFDDQPIAQVVEPALTTIKQPIEEIGKKTMEVMMQVLTNQINQNEENVFNLPLILKVRESC